MLKKKQINKQTKTKNGNKAVNFDSKCLFMQLSIGIVNPHPSRKGKDKTLNLTTLMGR